MIKFEFLGRGSAFNYKEGCTSAYLKKDGMMLLIDCGRNTFDRIMELNLLDGVKELNILITHFHTDHCRSLGCLLSYTNYILGFKSNVYFGNIDILNTFMKITGSSKIYNTMNLDDFERKYYINIDYFTVNHVDDIDSYGYEFHDLNDDTWTIYSGDTSGSTCNILRWVGYADVIYHDCCLADYDGNVHTSINKLYNAVPHMWDRQNIYLMHLDNNKELIEKASTYGFNVVEVKQ